MRKDFLTGRNYQKGLFRKVLQGGTHKEELFRRNCQEGLNRKGSSRRNCQQVCQERLDRKDLSGRAHREDVIEFKQIEIDVNG